jgi:hypothetical protein
MAKRKTVIKKKPLKMDELGKTTYRENLLRVHSFLRKPFRKLEADELKSEEVFKELFPNDKTVEFYKLHAIYELQR